MTRAEALKLLKRYKIENAEKYGIHNLGIFGSFSRDEQQEDSDIDIVIETAEPDPFKLVHIKEDLEAVFNKNIDLIRKRDKMNPYLLKRINKDAIYV